MLLYDLHLRTNTFIGGVRLNFCVLSITRGFVYIFGFSVINWFYMAFVDVLASGSFCFKLQKKNSTPK